MNHRTAYDLPSVTKLLRIVWFAMLSSIFLLVAVAENYDPRTQEKASWFFFKLITGLVTAMAVSSRHRRQRYIAGGQLLTDPTDGKALKRWQLGHIIIQFAFSESMALYGLILRYQGFTLLQVAAFYLAAVGFMFLGYPKEPRPGNGSIAM